MREFKIGDYIWCSYYAGKPLLCQILELYKTTTADIIRLQTLSSLITVRCPALPSCLVLAIDEEAFNSDKYAVVINTDSPKLATPMLVTLRLASTSEILYYKLVE
jgi:hypothetical protein